MIAESFEVIPHPDEEGVEFDSSAVTEALQHELSEILGSNSVYDCSNDDVTDDALGKATFISNILSILYFEFSSLELIFLVWNRVFRL